MPPVGVPRGRLGYRLLWFVGLWAAGSFAVAGVAYALRMVLRP